MMSVEFVYLACFISVHSFRQGFVLGTLGPQVSNRPSIYPKAVKSSFDLP